MAVLLNKLLSSHRQPVIYIWKNPNNKLWHQDLFFSIKQWQNIQGWIDHSSSSYSHLSPLASLSRLLHNLTPFFCNTLLKIFSIFLLLWNCVGLLEYWCGVKCYAFYWLITVKDLVFLVTFISNFFFNSWISMEICCFLWVCLYKKLTFFTTDIVLTCTSC